MSLAAVLVAGVILIAAVLAAVHHAEVVAHKVGEPLGSIVPAVAVEVAVAVTVIEVGLIITLVIGGGGHGTETLARDTALAAVMIACNGIVGLSLLLGSLCHGLPRFTSEGTGAALGVVATLAGLTLVLPAFTVGASGGRFTAVQLAFIATQTGRHRDFFLPVEVPGKPADEDHNADPPSTRATVTSLVLLAVSLLSVVALGHAVSPAIEGGLAVPAIAVASIWLEGTLMLGLGPVQIVLLVPTMIVNTVTIAPGRSTRLQGIIHLIILASFVFLAISP